MKIKSLSEKWVINILRVESVNENEDNPYSWSPCYSYNPKVETYITNDGEIKYFDSEKDAWEFILSGDCSYGDSYQISKVYKPVYE